MMFFSEPQPDGPTVAKASPLTSGAIAIGVAVTLVLTGMVNYTELAGESATLATAFELNGITWAQKIISFGALAGLTRDNGFRG